jgi:hypothetical protein
LILGSTLSVWQDAEGVVWDATLVNHEPEGEQKLDVLRIQLLVCQGSQGFHTWGFGYQIGTSKESKSVGDVGSLDSAKKAFETMFKNSSGLAWEDRHALPLEDKWIFVEPDHKERHTPTTQLDTSTTSVDQVLGVILSPKMILESYYTQLIQKSCRNLVSLDDKVQGKMYLFGVAILRRLTTLTRGTKDNNTSLCKERLLKTFNRLIPKNVPTTMKSFKTTLEALNHLGKMHNAKYSWRSDPSSPWALSLASEVMGLAKMDPGMEALCILVAVSSRVLCRVPKHETDPS